MGYNNNESNQELRSFGIISTFVLLLVCGFAMVPVWNGSDRDNNEKAMRRAEGLAYQLIEIRRQAQNEGRGPASDIREGQIGADPWGQPYKYRMLTEEAVSASGNSNYRMMVWSQGPNKKSDTKNEVLDSNRDENDARFDGDDLGVVVVVK